MAYTKTVYVDRAVQFPNRYDKTLETSGSVTLTANSGTITAAGTPVNAANLNKLETAVEGMVGKDNTSIVETTSLKLETDTRNNTMTWTNGVPTQILEKNASTTMKTTNITWTNGLPTTIIETCNGRTVTTTLTWTNGFPVATSKTVV